MRVSIRHLMIVIAFIGFAMFAVREMFFANTVYSAGYDESRFRQVRVGMTSEEVEALLGPPLEKVPWWPEAERRGLALHRQTIQRWRLLEARCLHEGRQGLPGDKCVLGRLTFPEPVPGPV